MAVFEQQNIDLIVRDLFMPILDGAETIIAIRRLRPDFKIVAISAAAGSLGRNISCRLSGAWT
jgi:CheY-like chemotaxis protein